MNNKFFIEYAKINSEVKPPFQATEGSVGYDLTATSDPIVVSANDTILGDHEKFAPLRYGIKYIQYKTGLKISQVPFDNIGNVFFLLFPRSSVSNKNLLLANSVGVIDTDYKDEVLVRFKYVPQPIDYTIGPNNEIFYAINPKSIYQKGDRIAQIVFFEKTSTKLIEVNELGSINNSRGGGFGSTGN